MKRMNLGCANDIKEGWINTDSVYRPEFHDIVEIWDARHSIYWNYTDFDFILINHVLCTMPYNDVRLVLKNVYEMLKPGGTVQIVDMDMIKAIYAYQNKQENMFPIEGGDIDWKFCMHVSGYSTRPSIFTPALMKHFLIEAGFNKFVIKSSSEYDTRPDESFVIEAIK